MHKSLFELGSFTNVNQNNFYITYLEAGYECLKVS